MDLEFLVGLVANIAGAAGAVYAVYRHFDTKRAAPVAVRLVNGDDTVVSFTIPRSQFSRAELMGRMGMLSKGGRFSIAEFSSPEILPVIDAVTAGKTNTFTLRLTDAEKEQF